MDDPEATILPNREDGALEEKVLATLSQLPSMTVGGGARGAAPNDIAPMSARVPSDVSADLSIQSVLGEGGFGIVYAAEQRSLNRAVALKVVRVGRPAQLASLLYEARLMGSLEHPSIIPVHALGTDAGGQPVLVMKRVEGTSWQALLEDDAHPVWDVLAQDSSERLLANLDILHQVTGAIAFAHSRGVIHRDIKPANVLVGSFGEVYLADWGIALDLAAKSEEPSGAPIGTPAFMAPEMAVGDEHDMDERTDVYLLGATLHYALTRKPRHSGNTIHEVVDAAIASQPVQYDDSVPPTLAELANRSTALDRDDRPATALEFRDAIDEFLRHHTALTLAQHATETLDRALELASTRSPTDEAQASELRTLLLEARFGFNEALRDWPANEPARLGKEKVLAAAFELEISERALGAAKAIAAEMASANAETRARLAALEKELSEEVAERDAARALVRAFDPAVAQRKRTIFIAVLSILGIGITLGMRHSRLHGTGAPVPHTIVLPLVLALALSPVAWWLRADASKSAVNQRFLAIIYVVFGASAILRAIAYLYQTDINQMMTFELLLIGTTSATLGVSFQRSFFWNAGAAVACAFLAQHFPSWLEAFYVPPFLGLIALSTLTRRSRTLVAGTSLVHRGPEGSLRGTAP